MKSVKRLILLLLAFAVTVTWPAAFAQPLAPYSAVEVDPFAAEKGVNLPPGYQTALVDTIARELSVEFSTLIILRQGELPPDRQTVLRISGTVVQFKPGNAAKKLLTGFGGGAAVAAGVRFGDASSGRVVTIREFQASPDSLGRKIAQFCKSEHLVESH
jgi:hypothetical protein